MKHKLHLYKKLLCLFLFAFSVFSCSEKTFDEVIKTQDFDHLTAKSFFENNISTLKIPDMFISEVETRTTDSHLNGYRVDWSKFNYSENEDHYIYEFNLSTEGYKLYPAMFSNVNGNISHIEQEAKIKSSLVIMKSKTTDSLKIFVNTLVGYMTNKEDLCAFNEDKSDFRGFQIFTDCDGNCLSSGYLYKDNGGHKLYLKKYDKFEYSQLPLSFFRVFRHVDTKVDEFIPGYMRVRCPHCGYLNDLPYVCQMCGELLPRDGDSEDGPIIGGGDCPQCGMNPCVCDPCLRCGYDPCVCPDPNDGCIYCFSEDCVGECRN